MNKAAIVVPALCCFTLLAAPRAARAEPILLTQGYVEYEFYDLGNMQLIAGSTPYLDFGFWGRMDAALGGTFAPHSCYSSFQTGTQIGTGCAPGSTVSLDASWSGSQLPGNAVMGHTGWSNVGGPDPSDPQAGVSIAGSFVLPAQLTSPWNAPRLQAPFTLTGFFDHPDPSGAMVREDLFGHGTATIDILPLVTGMWSVGTVHYQLEPTPEPASLMLLGVGVVAVARRRRRSGDIG